MYQKVPEVELQLYYSEGKFTKGCLIEKDTNYTWQLEYRIKRNG